MEQLGYISLGLAIGLGIAWIYYLWWKVDRILPKEDELKANDFTPTEVGAFYDIQSANFLKVYGEVIQAFRTRDVTKLLDYQAAAMELRAGKRVLDAGCGIGGPACYFAKEYKVVVQGLTISQVQAEEGKNKVQASGLHELVEIKQGDYHRLQELYPHESFDVVCFLESFGHAANKEEVLSGAFQVLKPGGMLYIKDLFVKEAILPEHAGPIKQEIDQINTAYRYQVADLYKVLRQLRKLGFILSAVKTIDLKLEEFENLSISNDFQELTGIYRIDDWENYVFPVDFFEVICYRPHYNLDKGTSRYFLQNLYHMKVWGKQQHEL